MKRSAHSKAVLDDSRITVDTTSIHQHKLYYCDRSYLSHSESEQYKLHDSVPIRTWQRGGLRLVTDKTEKTTCEARTNILTVAEIGSLVPGIKKCKLTVPV